MEAKRIVLTKEDCMTTSISALYDAIAQQMGCQDVADVVYDCTKIDVSKGVQSAFYEECIRAGHDEYSASVAWAVCGPKATIDSNDCLAEPKEGFILKKTQ